LPPPMIEAWNKLDLLDPEAEERARELAGRRDDVVILSAVTGAGMDDLQRAISSRLTSGAQVHQLQVPLADGAALAWLHEHGEVLESRPADGDMIVDVRLSDSAHARFLKRTGA
ncbi:MAG TPA: GTPase HflX, partial [Sphingobium sp.]|nr:GTPase HflX [Sphingobium sp.]